VSAAIVVSHVSKTFRRYHPERPRTIQEVLARGLRRLRTADRFWGLRDVSFEVPAGRTVGIIGTNGSGKSTLLRLVGGVGKVDEGQIQVRGRIGALLDLGSGFHPDLTGRENAIVSGVLAGLTRREVLARLDSIVAFAEVEKFIDNPMRTYSTGMQMRLAFATAVHIDPEVLLIDEVLSVGDTAFQRKCLQRIEQFKANGCSILLVSHESSVVQDLCDEALWINQGRLMAHDRAADVVGQYLDFISERAVTPARPEAEPHPVAPAPKPTVRTDLGSDVAINEDRFGSIELRITGVRLVGGDDQDVAAIDSGDQLRIDIAYLASEKVISPIFRVSILRDDGSIYCEVDSEKSELSLTAVEGPGCMQLFVDTSAFVPGRYRFNVAAGTHDHTYAYDQRSTIAELTIRGAGSARMPPHRWQLVPHA
jgi:lipopolysaccharide transport system ATP-binding protein